MGRITLDAETFKALASSTRLTVLRALDERRKTLTELATDLTLNKATVHEHLQLLLSAGLIRKRDDEGRKWIYYELTWTGQGILHPQETTSFNVLLGLSVAAAGGGFAMLGRALGWWLQEKASDRSLDGEAAPSAPAGDEADAPAAEGLAARAPEETEEAPAKGDPFFDQEGWIALALLTAALLFTLLAALVRRKLRPASPAARPEGAE